ncbi:MAG: adenosine kinase [Microgenomates group bacterium LiPW_16]|nr:MAG: adenosine kinase [Microgenomates group bacterium LiPW_16]
MKIIITGSLAFDFIMDFPGKFSDHILPEKIHAINLSFLVKTMKKQRGGTAGNIAYNLALLGLRPTILAAAGNDFADYKNFLKKSGVDTSMIRIIRVEPTASAFIFTDMADNQITGFYPGAMRQATKLKIEAADFVVIAPNEPEAMINFAKECQKFGIPYLFDPGMQLPRLSVEDLACGVRVAKILIGNDYEMALINEKLKRKMDKDKILITTLGEKGSIIEADGKIYKIPPAKPKKVLDPTGAGDAYRAGFLAGYLRGFHLSVCGKMGSVCAVYTVEKYGTQTHRFTLREFTERYKQNFKQNLSIS